MGRTFSIGLQEGVKSEELEVKPTRTYSIGNSVASSVQPNVKVTRKYTYKIDTSTTPPKKSRVEVE